MKEFPSREMGMRFLLLRCALMVPLLGPGCAASDSGSAGGSGGKGSGGTGTGGSGSGGDMSTAGTDGSVSGGSGGGSGSGGAAPDAATDKPAGGDSGSSAETGVPAAGCTGVTAKYCDDFEMQMDGKAPTGDFTLNGPAGGVLVDTSKPFRGAKSMHFKLPRPAAGAQLHFSKQFPMNDLNGRAMVFMSRVPTNGNHWDLLYSYFDKPGGQTEWELGGQSGVFELVCDPGGGAPELDNSSKTKFPIGKWFCLQWRFKNGAGAGNTYTVKVDGTAVDKGDFTGNQWPAGTWKNMTLGWVTYPGSSSDVDIEFWIDDLAFGEQEIACLAAP